MRTVREGPRNLEMAELIESAPAGDPLRFVVAGDSGAWPDPTAEAIFARLIQQVGELDPAPAFFANLGDFAGPGTSDRHSAYLEVVEHLPVPDICVVGNHDLDDADGLDHYEALHGPTNFDFAQGHTRFVVIHSQPSAVGIVDVPGMDSPEGGRGPREEDLAFLAARLEDAAEPRRVVLMHMPPHMGGRLRPHEDWGFTRLEADFLQIIRSHGVDLVCCAHGLAFDTYIYEGIRFVMSGGGGTGLCSHLRGVCARGSGSPEDRGALFHAVELTVPEEGEVSGRVIQAFAPREAPARLAFPAP